MHGKAPQGKARHGTARHGTAALRREGRRRACVPTWDRQAAGERYCSSFFDMVQSVTRPSDEIEKNCRFFARSSSCHSTCSSTHTDPPYVPLPHARPGRTAATISVPYRTLVNLQ